MFAVLLGGSTPTSDPGAIGKVSPREDASAFIRFHTLTAVEEHSCCNHAQTCGSTRCFHQRRNRRFFSSYFNLLESSIFLNGDLSALGDATCFWLLQQLKADRLLVFWVEFTTSSPQRWQSINT